MAVVAGVFVVDGFCVAVDGLKGWFANQCFDVIADLI